MTDILGEALNDFYRQHSPAKLWIHNNYGPKEEMPVEVYFRNPEHMPELELTALKNCRGKVLDIGAGAGSHALLLQQMNMDVTALDISPKAVTIMQQRGVHKTLEANIFAFNGQTFDTLLLLMNGIGLTGTVEALPGFLQHAKTLLNAGGRIIFDSSDITYLNHGKPLPGSNYYGEIKYRYQYKKQKSAWFNWLYVDKHTLGKTALQYGWKSTVLFEDEYDQYLVQLTV